MKILKFLIIFFSINIYIENVLAQMYPLPPKDDFFMPAYETAPVKEKLPPLPKNNINQTYNSPTSQYDVKYKLVNGVYVPTFTKKIVKKQPSPNILNADEHPLIKTNPYPQDNQQYVINDNLNNVPEQPISTANLPIKEQEPIKTEISTNTDLNNNNIITLPVDDTIHDGVPPYRNIYAKYLQDTKVFQTNRSFPYNEGLEQSLQKMTSNKKITIFRGPVKPILKK